MATFREIVSMVLDRNKLSNDDAYIGVEHVMFLASKLRAYILTSKYKQIKSQISPSNFQTLKLELQAGGQDCACDTGGMHMVKSKKKIPELLLINNYEGHVSVAPVNFFGCASSISMVSPIRFLTVGSNKWQRLQSYATVGDDRHLYIKSADSLIEDLEEVQITAVFENAEEAAKMQAEAEYDECAPQQTPCDALDMPFPLEEGLVTLLIDNLSQALFQTVSLPQDIKNSSNDEMGSLMNYINSLLKDRYRRGSGVEND